MHFPGKTYLTFEVFFWLKTREIWSSFCGSDWFFVVWKKEHGTLEMQKRSALRMLSDWIDPCKDKVLMWIKFGTAQRTQYEFWKLKGGVQLLEHVFVATPHALTSVICYTWAPECYVEIYPFLISNRFRQVWTCFYLDLHFVDLIYCTLGTYYATSMTSARWFLLKNHF